MYALRCAGVAYGFFDGSFGTGIQICANPTPRRIESGLHLQHAPEAAHEQAGADEEHERDRDFRRDQRAAEAALAAPRAAMPRPASFRLSPGLTPETWIAGTMPNTTPAAIDSAETDRDHAAVEMHFGQPRQIGWHHRNHPVFQPRQRGERRRPAGNRDDETFDEQLADELSARGAERPPHRNFADAARRPRQRQVRDVHARDERAAARRPPSAR